MIRWRQGKKVKLNVYEGSRPVCQCHNEQDAEIIVDAYNHLAQMVEETTYLVRNTPGFKEALEDVHIPPNAAFDKEMEAVGGLSAFKRSMESTFMPKAKHARRRK